MALKKSVRKASELKFYQRLVLNQYVLSLFGVKDLPELARNMKKPALELVDEEGVSEFYKSLIRDFGDVLKIDTAKLLAYDLNIIRHTRMMNDKRGEKITLKYFQYLSLLFVEYYLDSYFNDQERLLTELNNFVTEFNREIEAADQIALYSEKDINKIALWNATGSGKTLLMHINYYQYLHYSAAHTRENEEANILLLTPNEGLSEQHLIEFQYSDVKAVRFNKADSKWMKHKNEITVIENTKFAEKDGDKTVSVHSFGSSNLVFVDEGHKGSSGDKWKPYRDMLCADGFSFEYSATFGQAIKAANKPELTQEYAKCILFDYSYKYFYSDGYGKDYNILNLSDDSVEHQRQLYLTAGLLTYYQQKKLYMENQRDFTQFNLEKPLFVFVGGSVNAVRTERKKPVSDVVDILMFFADFVQDSGTSIASIERILSGTTGLLDNKNRDIFKDAFIYLTSLNCSAEELFKDILSLVFNCNTAGAGMHIENLRGVQGEIRVRVGENPPFGLINVGDDADLVKLCKSHGLETGAIDFSGSLFQNINEENSTINVLIGSKKFTEGWNCWRVSMMGLMNVGRSEGSEIIQLFGRGVRLKGHGMSLKRSNFFIKDRPDVVAPKFITLLETLNIFGVRADYMKQFKDYLEAEGVPTEKGQPIIRKMPVIRNSVVKNRNLYTLKVRGDMDYKKHAAKPALKSRSDLSIIVLDCYAKLQFETSKAKSLDEVTKNETYFKKENLAFFNYDEIYFELQRYKNEKARFNLNISKQDIIDLLNKNDWYKLLIPEAELILRDFEDYKRWQRIAITLLRLYCDKFYYAEKNKWEAPLLEYAILEENDINFLENDEYTISIANASDESQVVIWLDNIIKKVKAAKASKNIIQLPEMQTNIAVFDIPAHLYNPLIYVAKNSVEITVSPVALVESEYKFVKDLKDYVVANKTFFYDKELYLIRNKSKKGIGFFESSGFYPDFIMWLISGGKQYITFIDPKGMGRMSIRDDKVQLSKKIKTIEASRAKDDVVLNSILLSDAKYRDMIEKSVSKDEWKTNNVFFIEDEGYIGEMLARVI